MSNTNPHFCVYDYSLSISVKTEALIDRGRLSETLSDFQPVFRGKLVFRERSSGVPQEI